MPKTDEIRDRLSYNIRWMERLESAAKEVHDSPEKLSDTGFLKEFNWICRQAIESVEGARDFFLGYERNSIRAIKSITPSCYDNGFEMVISVRDHQDWTKEHDIRLHYSRERNRWRSPDIGPYPAISKLDVCLVMGMPECYLDGIIEAVAAIDGIERRYDDKIGRIDKLLTDYHWAVQDGLMERDESDIRKYNFVRHLVLKMWRSQIPELKASPPEAIAKVPHLKYRCPSEDAKGFVYFLCHKGEVVYVGQTVDLAHRLKSHEKDKTFSSVYYIEVDQRSLLKVESEYIEKLMPKYNRTIKKPRKAAHVA